MASNGQTTPQVSMDDDLEGLFQFTPCVQDLGLDTRLAKLPRGSLQMVVEDALQRMKKSGAFLWALNVSDNPFYMYHGVSHKNGLCFLADLCPNRRELAQIHAE
jgi:hypothetical protein